MRHRLLLLALFSLACWFPATNCPISQALGDGSSTDRPSGWRRTVSGWEEASRWHLDARPDPHLTPAMAVHPLVIASLELLISVGGLVVASPASRK